MSALTPDAVEFLVALDRAFAGARADLLDARRRRRRRLARGEETLDFLPETAAIRADTTWRVPEPPPGLTDRRVEITGPPTPSMAVNALNSGARVWMADFEDATAPTWENILDGHTVLREIGQGRRDFTGANGKRYRIGDQPATIVARPRGWHLVEKHIVVDGRPIPAALVDAGLHLFHGGRLLYLPKLEGHREARLWNDVFRHAQSLLGLPVGTIRATVLIETIAAAFEMDEILYELREHAAGLNAGRWDYIFSIIKTIGHERRFVLPDRAAVTMTAPFMRAYTDLLVRTAHRRGAYAIGGMSAFVPSRDPAANARAFDQVRADKQREAADGFDGSWVAHPALVPACVTAFTRPDQRDRLREDVSVTAADLLNLGDATVTEAGLRNNITVALAYLDAWIGGTGAVAIGGLMEDAATAEIARAQVWQWLHHGTTLTDDRPVSHDLVGKLLAGAGTEASRRIFTRTALGPELPAFFTPQAYADHLVSEVRVRV
ncbi:malate synthase A [Catenuloplanes japonicus]|uniref:malate synthase A n=1 Tax=Catenuloplanes japonicus TaxID=33876 RepID=UPI0006900628|nr:malate synthase A [Catenuloplanes japonicus]